MQLHKIFIKPFMVMCIALAAYFVIPLLNILLHHYHLNGSPAKQALHKIREKVFYPVPGKSSITGFIFDQYSDANTAGK